MRTLIAYNMYVLLCVFDLYAFVSIREHNIHCVRFCHCDTTIRFGAPRFGARIRLDERS